jgi:hypothetical protein
VTGVKCPLPATAYKALSCTVQHGYITVIVKNPYAGPSWYQADFQARSCCSPAGPTSDSRCCHHQLIT